ncbi:hypothetical protein [Allocoleopsis franciscana]|uniref:Uncharacterized protein n=1 Tax=Allocoleopsis franciscana PCC 7113 TaxID=1173027 RepID=K9WIB2_9CYAN|nr:hypothetical protein [Allocoleopsis franciscana]AFZ19519.1 hypothetical protein Mic7113_3802 [Allocoleopsis franciscana PCC 7113]
MMSHKVYAPNIHLFAFHSSHEPIPHSSLSKDFDDELLWEKCNDIFVKFKIEQQLKIRKISDGLRVALLEGATDNMISLPLVGQIFHQAQSHRMTGFACPLKIENNYALALNLRIPEFNEKNQKTEELELTFFKDLNQDHCFLPRNISSSIGQTVLLTGWLSQRQQPNQRLWREIADECVQNFLGKELEQCPPLYQSGQLFGSPIFEYGNPYQPHSDGQIVVWLFVREVFNGKVDSKIDNNFGFFYQKMIDLLYYRQKIIKAYQLALEAYSEIQDKNQKIIEIINQIGELPQEQEHSTELNQALSDIEVNDFKEKLRILPKLALDYTDGIQAIESDRLTLEANTKNYVERLRQVQERLPHYDLSFLSSFPQKTSGIFQDDLKVKLHESMQKSSLVGKAIASIRGIVEIDKVQRDRTLEETLRTNEIAAQQREKKLQIWFALVVICLAVSTIYSQISSPVKTVLNYLHPEQHSESPLASFIHFFFYYFFDLLLQTLVGLFIALLLGLVVWLIPTPTNHSNHSKE